MRAIFGISMAMALGAVACASSGGAGSGLGSGSGPGAASAAPGPVAPHFTEGNGEIVQVAIPGAPALAFRLLFYTGSADDPRGKEGLTTLTARLMAEGGTLKMTYSELLRALYPMAADIEVTVEKEQTVFSGEVHPDHAAKFVSLLRDVVLEPRFAEADFIRVRDELVNDIEKRLRSSDDEDLGKEMLSQMLYAPEHPYGHFDGGTVEGLKSITLGDVRAHAAQVFGKRRLLVGVAGPVSEDVLANLRTAFAELPEGLPRIAQIPAVPKPGKVEVLIAEKPVKAVAISIGYTHEAFRGHPDFSELGLVQSYFGEHRQFHGVLMSEMREKRGLNYGDYAYVEKFIQHGYSRHAMTNIARRRQHFEIWIRPVDPTDAVFSTRLALFLLDRMVKEGVPEQGVVDTKQFLAGYTRLWDLTPSRRLGYALDDRFYGVDGYLDRYREDLAKTNAVEVNAALRRHLVAGPVKIAMVAPDAEALKAALVSGAPSSKKYGAQVPEDVLALDARVGGFPLGIQAEDVKIVKVEELFVR